MNYRRIKGSSLLWVLYTLFVCAVLARIAGEAYDMFQIGRIFPAVGDYGHLLAAAGGVLVVFLFSWLLRFIFRKRNAKTCLDEKYRLWEWLFCIFVIAAAFALRLYLLSGEEGGNERILQLVYLLAGMAVLYPAVRQLFGKCTAVITVAGVAFLPQYLKGNLLFVLFCILLMLTAWLFVRLCDRDSASWPVVVLLGILTGGLSSWNLVFSPVFLLAVCGLILMDDPFLNRFRLSAAVMYIVSALIGFGGYGLTRLLLLNETVYELLQYWMAGLTTVAESFWRAEPETLVLIVLAVICVFYVFGSFGEQGNKGLVWILPFLSLNLYSLHLISLNGEELIFILNWLIMAGVSVHSVICRNEEGALMFRRKEKKAEKEPARVLQPGEPIPNPLPGPKKHVHKEMDYAFIPEESQMCFDINELEAGKDEFDID